MAYVIEQALCSACHRCRTECPKQAIRFKNAKYWIDPEKCVSCGRCAKVCHNGCISDPARPAPPAEPHDRIVKICDVCVIGGGGSGLVAANRAQDCGRSVIVLEKMHEVGGSSWYAGGFRIHWCKRSAELGHVDDRERKYEEFWEKSGHSVDPKLLRRMFEANEQHVNWLLEEHDAERTFMTVAGHMGPGPEVVMMKKRGPWKDAGKRIDRMIGPGEVGSEMALFLQEEFLKGGGELLLKTSAKELLTDGNGGVCGVLAADAGGEIEIRCKAVIVASGAFSRNRALMKEFQPIFCEDEGKEPVHIFTGAGCTGDGITMCRALGADVDTHNKRAVLFGPMRHPYPCASMAIYQSHDGFEIGSQGDPFHGSMGVEISALTRDPKWFGWKIMDDAMAQTAIAEAMEEPPQSPGMDLPKFQARWREVLAEEALDNAVVMADTPEELADKLGVDRAKLLEQIEAYNEQTRHPKPLPPDLPEFMRPKHPPMAFGKGPWYAVKMKMFHENAIGGMVIDENASVLRAGKPIPGLYACGDTTRGIMFAGDLSVSYLEGVFTSLTQAYDEGYIAGLEAAAYAEKLA